MKKFFIYGLVLALLQCCTANAEENSVQNNTPITKEQLNNYTQNINNNVLTAIEKAYRMNVIAAAQIYLDIYDMYKCLNMAENTFGQKYQENKNPTFNTDYTASLIGKSTTWYDSEKQERYYTKVDSKHVPALKIVISNLNIIETQEAKLVNNLQQVQTTLKNTPDKKNLYSKEDLKTFHKLYKRVKRNYSSVKYLNNKLKDSANANNINIEQKTALLGFTKPYSELPTMKNIEDAILNDSNNITYNTDTATYYNKINKKREKILPVLSSLIVTADKAKELELKRKYLESQNNLSEKEREAQLNKILKEEEAAILEALETKDINEKFKQFSAEQQEQYSYVIQTLTEITLMQLDRVATQVADVYNAYNSSNGDVLQALSAYSSAHPSATKEEEIYIEIVRKRGTASSKVILDKLNSFDEIRRIEKDTNKGLEKTKQKKSKKIKEEDLEI